MVMKRKGVGKRPAVGARRRQAAGRRRADRPGSLAEVKQRVRHILDKWVLPRAAAAVAPFTISDKANLKWRNRYIPLFIDAIKKKKRTWEEDGPNVLLKTDEIARYARRLAEEAGNRSIEEADAERASNDLDCGPGIGRAGGKGPRLMLFWCEPQP